MGNATQMLESMNTELQEAISGFEAKRREDARTEAREKQGRLAEIDIQDGGPIVVHKVYKCRTEGKIIVYNTGCYYGADSLDFCIAKGHKVAILKEERT